MPHEGLSSLLQMRAASPNNMVLAKQTHLCPPAAGRGLSVVPGAAASAEQNQVSGSSLLLPQVSSERSQGSPGPGP